MHYCTEISVKCIRFLFFLSSQHYCYCKIFGEGEAMREDGEGKKRLEKRVRFVKTWDFSFNFRISQNSYIFFCQKYHIFPT